MVETENLWCETAHQIRIHVKIGCGQTGLAGQRRAERNKRLARQRVSCMHAAIGERNLSMCGLVTKQTLGVVTRGLNTRLLAIVNCETYVKLYTYRGHQPPPHTNSKNPKLWKCTQGCWCTVHSGWLCIGWKSTSGKKVSWQLQDLCKMSSKK